MKANVSITFTRHTGRFSKKEISDEASFDDQQSTFIEVAPAVIDALKEYVENARLRRR